MIIATLTLTMDDTGRVNLEGPLSQQAQCYAMLQMGMDCVRAFNAAPTVSPMIFAEPGKPAEPAEPFEDKPRNEGEKIAVIQEAKSRGADIPADLTDVMYRRACDFLSGGHYPNDVVTVVEREAAEAVPEPVKEDSKLSALSDLASF